MQGGGHVVMLFFLSYFLAVFSSLQEISNPTRALLVLEEHSIAEPQSQSRC